MHGLKTLHQLYLIKLRKIGIIIYNDETAQILGLTS
jgi:hypothetical protein